MCLSKEIFKRKTLFLILISVVIVASVILINGSTSLASISESLKDNEYNGIGYNSITFEEESQLTDIKIDNKEDNVEVHFSMDGNDYHINADKIDKKDENVKYFTETDVLGDKYKSFTVILSDDYISGIFRDMSANKKDHSQDKSNGFSFIISKDNTDLESTINQAKKEPKIKKDIDHNNFQLNKSSAYSATTNNLALANVVSSVHALADGTSIPFLLSSGTSEGWADVLYGPSGPGGRYIDVGNLKYSVTYNLPGDGVYIYVGGNIVYATPTFTSGGLKSVPGSWTIEYTNDAHLSAITSVSALVKGVPIAWEVFDRDFFQVN